MNNDDSASQLAVAKNPKTSPSVLDKLAESMHELVLLAVSQNAASSNDARLMACKKLIRHDIFLRKIASNPLTPPQLLGLLADYKLDEVRLDVATNKATPEAALVLLASDKDRYIRGAIARNPATSDQMLAILADEVDPYVSGGVATNPSTPEETLLTLACAKNSLLRFGVMLNPSVPNHILERLLEDEFLHVRKQAQVMLKLRAAQSLSALSQGCNSIASKRESRTRSVNKRPRNSLLTGTNSELIIHRSIKVENQISRVVKLKKNIIEDIKCYFPDVLKKKMAGSDERYLLRHIELAAESFGVTFQESSPDSVCRTASMLSGPFFTSKKYPIPKAKSEMLYPIVQLDLRTASALAGESIGDGLLQLWYDINAFKGLVRVIPRSDVTTKQATEFHFIPAQKFDGFPLPNFWDSDPIGDYVQVMSEYKSKGVACQKRYGGAYLDGISERFEVPDDLYSVVEKFEDAADFKNSSRVHLLGSFYPIQYSAAAVGKRCLLDIGGDWGASGGAQIFYSISKSDKVSFEFRDCLR